MFQISRDPIISESLKKFLRHSGVGAEVCFEGIIRDRDRGRHVTALEYEVYEKLAAQEGSKILKEARQKFNIFEARGVHRVGYLKVSETALWVGVSASHRSEAFAACQYIINEIKTRLPIWKKEYFIDGDILWLNDSITNAGMVFDEQEFYARQRSLPDVSANGQEKLKKASVLVVGAGGLGSAALLYLAGAGLGTIGICEHDTLEMSNLHRQVLYAFEDIGKPKIQLAFRRITRLNPSIRINLHPEKISAENAAQIIDPYDVILDCTDDLPTKFLLNDLSVLFKRPLILCSVYQLEGRIQLVHAQKNTPCLRCLWPGIPPKKDRTSPRDSGILGVTPGLFGVMQAAEAIKIILGLPSGLKDGVLYFELRDFRAMKIRQDRNPSCPLCGQTPCITRIVAENYLENDKDKKVHDSRVSLPE